LTLSAILQTRPLLVQTQEQFFVTSASASASADTREPNFYG